MAIPEDGVVELKNVAHDDCKNSGKRVDELKQRMTPCGGPLSRVNAEAEGMQLKNKQS